MGRRTAETKRKDTNNGDRAELLCAIAWLATSPEDRIVKSSELDDIKKHIDYYVHKPCGKIITYDAKARRFEEYAKAFSENHYFVAEIKNRQGIAGSIYGEQDFMAHEISGKFIWIRRQLIVNEVENDVKPFGMNVDRIDSAYRNLYHSNKYDDGHLFTVFPFNEFKYRELRIPDEFLTRQFEYSVQELRAYIVRNNLKIEFND